MTTPPKARIAALMIGRGGSTLPDKNVLPVFGQPLLHYTAAAARGSRYIGRFYASSDCQKILHAASTAGYQSIARPAELSTPTSQSVDVVNHALKLIEQDGGIDILVVQHANVGTINTKMIDDCIEALIADDSLSSVVPVHDKSEYHPFRAKTPDAEGLIVPFFDFSKTGVSGNRQDLPTAYFFDHSIWVLSVERGIRSTNGQPPWTCMGNKIKPYVTEGCFDVHTIEDLKKTEDWLVANHVSRPTFSTPPELSHD
jgi:CMP-N-acetylneuraminic acid synthetase